MRSTANPQVSFNNDRNKLQLCNRSACQQLTVLHQFANSQYLEQRREMCKIHKVHGSKLLWRYNHLFVTKGVALILTGKKKNCN